MKPTRTSPHAHHHPTAHPERRPASGRRARHTSHHSSRTEPEPLHPSRSPTRDGDTTRRLTDTAPDDLPTARTRDDLPTASTLDDLPTARSFDDLPLVLTLPQVTHLLAVDRRTIYAAIRRGDLRAFKIGNAYRIERSALLSFIRADRPHNKRR